MSHKLIAENKENPQRTPFDKYKKWISTHKRLYWPIFALASLSFLSLLVAAGLLLLSHAVALPTLTLIFCNWIVRPNIYQHIAL